MERQFDRTITLIMKSKLKITRTIGTAAFAFGLAAVAITPVLAQGANAPLNIPANPVMFGKNDPNVRRATAIINGEIVTGTDVEQRLALIVSANGNKVDGEELDRLRMQVLRNLIDETLQIQEAKAADAPVDDAQVDATYDRVAAQNFGQSPEAMEKYLTRVGSSSASLKRQIRGELAWQNLLRRNVQPFVNVAEGGADG